MKASKHMDLRMRQRSFSPDMVQQILQHGEFNARGDRLTLGSREIDNIINAGKRWIEELERLRRRGGGTLVLAEETLVTVYPNEKRMRA